MGNERDHGSLPINHDGEVDGRAGAGLSGPSVLAIRQCAPIVVRLSRCCLAVFKEANQAVPSKRSRDGACLHVADTLQ
jgi:hypothetical protein